MEKVNVSKIFQLNDVIDFFPFNFQEQEKISLITYKLTKTINNNFFNYKQTVELIELGEGRPLNDNVISWLM